MFISKLFVNNKVRYYSMHQHATNTNDGVNMEVWDTWWDTCKGLLSDNNDINPALFYTLVNPLQPDIDVGSGDYLLLAPNEYVCLNATSLFGDVIKKTLATMPTPERIEPVFRVGNKPRKTTSSQRNGSGSRAKNNTLGPRGASLGTPVDPDLTFDSFVVGNSNNKAYTACLQEVGCVLDAFKKGMASPRVSKKYTPLALYGGVGLGKTHLLNAIGNQLQGEGVRGVVYEYANDLMKALVRGLITKTGDKVFNTYAASNVLLLDDVQFIKGSKMQEEILLLFNKLVDAGRLVVLTCDRYPTEIEGLEERLTSRFAAGLAAPIEAPERDTRAAILMQTATEEGRLLEKEVALELAERMHTTTGRELKAVMKQACYSATGARDAAIGLGEICRAARATVSTKTVSLADIKAMVAEYYHLEVADLISKRRPSKLVQPRQIAMTLARDLARRSYPEIGEAFGGRNHTTAMHAYKVINRLKKLDQRMQGDIEILTRNLLSNTKLYGH